MRILCLIAVGTLLLHMQVTMPARAAKTGKEKESNSLSAVKKPQKDPAETEAAKARRIEETLDYGTQEERLRAIAGIPSIKEPGERAAVIKKLIAIMKNESDPDVLVKAMNILGELKETSAIPLFIEKISHQSEEVRTAAVYAIKVLKAKEASGRLESALKEQKMEEASNYTIALISTLGELEAKEILPFVKQTIENPSTHRTIREEMVLFLGKVASRESGEILLKIYTNEDEDTTIRSYAANSLARLRHKDASPAIRKVIQEIESYDFKKRQKYFNLHLYSIAALAKLGDEEAVPKLMNALRSNSAHVRLKAIALIKELKDKRTIDILRYKMKYDQNPKVRAEARKALEEMGVNTSEGKE